MGITRRTVSFRIAEELFDRGERHRLAAGKLATTVSRFCELLYEHGIESIDAGRITIAGNDTQVIPCKQCIQETDSRGVLTFIDPLEYLIQGELNDQLEANRRNERSMRLMKGDTSWDGIERRKRA